MRTDLATALEYDILLTTRLTKLGCAVVHQPAHSLDPQYGQELEKLATCTLGVLLMEEVDSLAHDTHGTPVVHFKHCACVLLHDHLHLTQGSIPSIVHDNIDLPEVHLGGGECGEDVLQLHDVELEHEQVVGGVRCGEVGEDLGLAHGCNCSVTVFEDDLCKLAAEASQCTSDCRKYAG